MCVWGGERETEEVQRVRDSVWGREREGVHRVRDSVYVRERKGGVQRGTESQRDKVCVGEKRIGLRQARSISMTFVTMWIQWSATCSESLPQRNGNRVTILNSFFHWSIHEVLTRTEIRCDFALFAILDRSLKSGSSCANIKTSLGLADTSLAVTINVEEADKTKSYPETDSF